MGQVGVANRKRASDSGVPAPWFAIPLAAAVASVLAGAGVATAATSSTSQAPSTIPERRSALAAELQAAPSAAVRVPVAWRLADLEESAGNPDLAVRAEELALRNAGISALIDALTEDPKAPVSAARLHDAVLRAIARGDRAGAGSLVIDALTWEPAEAANHVDLVRRVVLPNAHNVPLDLRAQLRPALGTDPAWRAYLERQWNTEAPLIDDADLVKAGELGIEVLEERLSSALRDEDLTRALSLAEQLGHAEPQHLQGRIARLLLGDAQAAGLLTAKEAAAVLSEMPASSTVIAKLLVLQKAHPDMLALTIALAYRLHTVHLFADARREIDRIARAPRASDELRATALEIGAFADLELRHDADVQRWSQSTGAERSLWFASRVIARRTNVAPYAASAWKPPTALEHAALRRIFSEPFTPALAQLQFQRATDAALGLNDREDHDQRERALAVLHASSRPAEQQLRVCLATSVAADECKNRLLLLESLDAEEEDDDEDGARSVDDPAGAIDRLPDLQASWLSTLAHSDPAKLSALEPKLARLRTERYLGTPDLTNLEIAVACARRDWPAARAVLDRWGAVLSANEQLAIRLVIDAEAKKSKTGPDKSRADESKPAQISTLLSAANQLLPKVDDKAAGDAVADDDTEDEDDNDSKRADDDEPSKLNQVLYRWKDHPQRTLERLAKVWKRYDGATGADLAAWTWMAAQQAGKTALAREAMMRLERTAPASAPALRVKTAFALSRGRAGDALRSAARFWLAAPSSSAAGQMFAMAWVRAAPAATVSAAQRTWIQRAAGAGGALLWRWLADALDQSAAHSRAELAPIVDGEQKTERLLDAPLRSTDEYRLDWWSLSRLDVLPASEVDAFAARVAAYLAHAPKDAPATPLRFWAPYLAGDAAAAARALDRNVDPDARGKRHSLSTNRARHTQAKTLLLGLRDAPDVAFRQAMFRLFERRKIGTVDWPQKIATRAGSARDPKDAAALQQLACLGAAELGRVRQAISLCTVAWNKGARTPIIAKRLAGLTAGDPEGARLETFNVETFFREARDALGAGLPPEVLHDQALWLAKLHRREDATNLEVEAWLAGFELDAGQSRIHAFLLARGQPLLARVQESATMYGTDRDMRVGALAMAAGDLDTAAAHLQATRNADAPLTDQHKGWVDTLSDLIEVARLDLAQKHIDPATFLDGVDAYFDGTLSASLPGLLRRAPNSLFFGTLSATLTESRAQAPPAPLITTLQHAFPDNLTVQGLVIAALLLSNHADQAAALVAQLRARHPGEKRLDTLSAVTGGKPVEVPKWAATPDALGDALARVDPQALLAEAPHFERDQNDAMDVYVPNGFNADLVQKFAFRRNGLTLVGYRAPRMTHCLPAACLEDIAAVLKQQHIEQVWSHPARLPIGEGQQGLFKGPMGILLVVAVPAGPHVFYLSAGGPPNQMAEALPAIRFFLDTFRTPDAALGPKRTARLRPELYAYTTKPATGARARLSMAAAKGTGCPITSALAELEPTQRRGDLIANLYLATRDPADRVRLLACVSPAKDASPALALATLWDSTPEAAAVGRNLLTRTAKSAVSTLENGVDLTTEHRGDEALDERSELELGIIQALIALPATERRTLAQRLAASGEAALRALALAALHWVPDALPAAEQAEILRHGSDADAAVLAAGLPPILDGDLLQAARARLDATPESPHTAQRQVTMMLVPSVARALDPADGPRLSRLRKHLAERADDGDQTAKLVTRAIDAHHAASSADTPTTSARILLARWRAATEAAKSKTIASDLERPIRDRLPEHGWGYFRVGQPGVFVAALGDLARGASRTQDPRLANATMMISRLLSANGLDHLRDSGLDADSPFECAISTDDASEWACSAVILDHAALDRRLGSGPGRDLGLILPWSGGGLATLLPTANVFLPFLLPSGEPRPAHAHGKEPPARDGWLLKERVQDRIHESGIELERTTDLSVDAEHVVHGNETMTWVGRRRMWMFSDRDTARIWLTLRPPATTSAVAVIPARSTATVEAFWPANEDNDAPDGFFTELDSTSEGVHIRSRATLSRAPADTSRLVGLLPPGAITQVVAANLPDLPTWRFHPPGDVAETAQGTPPLWLWGAVEAIASGWYAADPNGGPEQWAAAVPWSAELERAWTEHGLPTPSTRPNHAGDLHFVRQGNLLALASTVALLSGVRAPASAPAAAPAIAASVSGPALVAAIERRVHRAPPDSRTAVQLGSWMALAAMIGSFETRATSHDGVLASDTWLRTSFPADARGAASIDEWLRSRRLKNTLRLPSAIDEQRAANPIVLLVRASRSEDVRRAFPGSNRLSVTDAGDHLFRVRVLPTPPPGTAARLAESDRRRFVDDPAASKPPVRATARDIVGAATSAWDRVRAVVGWVQREMTYEITPRYVDDVTLLGTKHGDCTEYAQLTVALLRALDVPARLRTGMLVAGTSMVAHAWAEFHDGNGWHEVDPTNGRTSVDASYVDASVIDLLPLLLDGRIEVTEIESSSRSAAQNER